MQPSGQIDLLSELIRRHFSQSTLLNNWTLDGGISAQMTALEIVDAAGNRRRLTLRRPRGNALAEYRLLRLTHRLGLPTPEPIHVEPSTGHELGPFLLLDHLDGNLQFAPANKDSYLRQMARQLAAIHRVTPLDHDLSFLPQAPTHCQELEREPASQVDPGFEIDGIGQRLATTRPEWLNAPVLLHGDYWPGNILWREENLVCVIDWEDAMVGDPLVDLSMSSLELCWSFGLDGMESFNEQYLAANHIDTTDQAYWDLCAALRIARIVGLNLPSWAANFAGWGRPDIDEITMRQRFRDFVSSALEKL